jgi:2-isopropylmalate synthase
VLGKLSGRAGLRARLRELGYELNDDELANIFLKFKDLADNKREITDMDLEALMSEQHRIVDTNRTYHVDSVKVVCGNNVTPKAEVTLECPNKDKRHVTSEGTGPVDAVCKAIDEVVKLGAELTEFSVSAVTEGIDSLGEVTIRIQKEGSVYSGRGSDSDIVFASAKAYVNAINRYLMISEKERNFTRETV